MDSALEEFTVCARVRPRLEHRQSLLVIGMVERLLLDVLDEPGERLVLPLPELSDDGLGIEPLGVGIDPWAVGAESVLQAHNRFVGMFRVATAEQASAVGGE